MNLGDIWFLIKQTFKEWSEDKAPRLAAALAYYTIFSLAPLLVIVIAIAGLVFGKDAAQNQIVGQIGGLVGTDQAGMIQTMIAGAQNQKAGIAATVIGIVTLLFGAAGVFGQLQDAMNTMWEVAPKPGRGLMGKLKDRFLSFTMVLGLGFLLLVSLVISAGLAAFGQWTLGLFPGFEIVVQVFNFVFSFVVITLLFALMFKILPDAKVAWKDVWLGAAVTAALFLVGRFLIQLYVSRSNFGSTYGAAGSIIVILIWIYYSTQILFLGAEFTQVYANKFGSRVVPEEDAVALTEEKRRQEGAPHGRQPAGGQAPAGKGTQPAAPADRRTLPAGRPTAFLPQTGRPFIREEMPMETQPTLFAFSTILATLAGFLAAVVVRRKPSGQDTRTRTPAGGAGRRRQSK